MIQLLVFILNNLFKPKPVPVQEIEYIPTPISTPKFAKLFHVAEGCLNQHLTLDDSVDPSVGCAQAVSKVLSMVDKGLIPPKGISGTASLLAWFKANPTKFQERSQAMPGYIIISPTGMSTKGFPHGHVGVCLEKKIASNNSSNGLWQDKFTYSMWDSYYKRDRGFPVYYYEVL